MPVIRDSGIHNGGSVRATELGKHFIDEGYPRDDSLGIAALACLHI
jgi:hypothetical protein